MPSKPRSSTNGNAFDRESWLALTLCDHNPNSKLLQHDSSRYFVCWLTIESRVSNDEGQTQGSLSICRGFFARHGDRARDRILATARPRPSRIRRFFRVVYRRFAGAAGGGKTPLRRARAGGGSPGGLAPPLELPKTPCPHPSPPLGPPPSSFCPLLPFPRRCGLCGSPYACSFAY